MLNPQITKPLKSISKEVSKLHTSLLARNFGWMLAGQGLSFGFQAVYFVMLARLLGATEYGIFAGAFAFTGLVAPYSPLGSGTVLLRYVSVRREAFPIYWGNVLVSVFGMSSLLIFALWQAAPTLLSSSADSLVLLAATSNCMFAALTEQTSRVFQCFERMRVMAGLSVLTNMSRALAVGWMLWRLRHATAWQWAAASTLISFASALIAVGAVTVSFGWPRFSLKVFLKHSLEGLGYSFATSTMSVYNDVDKTMLSHYGMNAADGIYTMAYRVVDMATIPVYSIREAVLPRLFKLGRSGIVESSGLSSRLLRRAFPLNMLVAVGIFLLAPLLPRIAGAGFAESVLALRWLCLIPVFRCVHILFGSVLTGAGLQSYRTVAQVSAALLNLSVNLWAIPRFGWLGAAWASILTDGTLCILTWSILRWVIFSDRHSEAQLT